MWTPEPDYPKPDISLTDVAYYHARMARLMLPFLKGRILNLFRCSEGRCFFQRNRSHPPAGDIFPSPIRFVPIAQKNGRTEDYLCVDDVDGIIACAALHSAEFHGWGSLADDIEHPDRLVIDLDPDPGLAFDRVRAAALQVRKSLHAVGLVSFPLLSGGKGIHVVVPLRREAEWQQVREFAKTFCTALAEADPGSFTVELRKERRAGRIFLDYLRNQRTATAILPYSARARDGAPVAAPISWVELPEIDRADRFTIADAQDLVRRAKGRELKGWGIADQSLPALV